MKLQYSFSILFVLKIVCSHPASSESDPQSENISGLSENIALDRVCLSYLDNSNTEKSRCDDESATTEIISSVKPFEISANHEDVIESFCSDPAYKSVEELAKEYSNKDNFTPEFHESNTSFTEANVIANSSTVNMVDGLSTNLTTNTYDEFQNNTFVPRNTNNVSAEDIQEGSVPTTEAQEAVDLEAPSAVALETNVPKPTNEDFIADAENTREDLSSTKN